MIVSFSVANFRSFKTEQTISLVANNKLPKHDEHLAPIPNSREKVLRTAVLYGANGAGKSNLFRALRYVESVALTPRERNTGTAREPFRLGNSTNQPSSFCLQFIAEGKLYEFGFEIDDERILKEWLFHIQGGRHRSVYERITSGDGDVKIEAPGFKEPKLAALATVGGPQNQSFLATVNATLDASDCGPDLSVVLGWFGRSLQLIAPDESFVPLVHLLSKDSEFLTFAGEFLKAASTGVDHLEILKKALSEDELRALLPPHVVRGVLRDAKEGPGVFRIDEGIELVVERQGKNSLYQIQAAHEHQPGKTVRLDLNDESDGTRRLLNLVPALHQLRATGAVFFIDEIDRSLHPMLVRQFLEFFVRSCPGGHGQVIVTTHESSLLDQDLLRRDEIWFAEKDQQAGTNLYSLMDFKVRNDLDLRKHYFQGRFGAVPFLGDLDNLLPEKGNCP